MKWPRAKDLVGVDSCPILVKKKGEPGHVNGAFRALLYTWKEIIFTTLRLHLLLVASLTSSPTPLPPDCSFLFVSFSAWPHLYLMYHCSYSTPSCSSSSLGSSSIPSCLHHTSLSICPSLSLYYPLSPPSIPSHHHPRRVLAPRCSSKEATVAEIQRVRPRGHR